MIDSTKSPTPAWQRYTVALLLTVLIAVVGYMLYSKQLHHGSSSSPPPPAASTHSKLVPGHGSVTPSTTIPGGIPISSRNPFGN